MNVAPKPEKWANSKAKAMLTKAILSGEVLDHMKPAEVHNMNAEYKKWIYPNFRSNLCNMRKSHRNGTLAVPSPPKWAKSPAKRLL